MAIRTAEQQNPPETPQSRAARLIKEGQEIPSKPLSGHDPTTVIKEWSYSDIKDLSMNLGGIAHDASVLLAAGVEPTSENVLKFRMWVEQIYEVKVDIVNKIKNQ